MEKLNTRSRVGAELHKNSNTNTNSNIVLFEFEFEVLLYSYKSTNIEYNNIRIQRYSVGALVMVSHHNIISNIMQLFAFESVAKQNPLERYVIVYYHKAAVRRP